jgi:DNA-binding YbaB/EbfC family protein
MTQEPNPLEGLMEMAQNLTSQMEESQRELEAATAVGTSGGGLVSVTLNGHLHLVGIEVDPRAVDPDDPSMLEDLIKAAWRDAHDQVAVLQAEANPMSGLGGDLGGLGGLLGGG